MLEKVEYLRTKAGLIAREYWSDGSVKDIYIKDQGLVDYVLGIH